MKQSIVIVISICFTLWTNNTFCQSSEIIKLTEKRAYKYVSYHGNGQIENEIGFYAKKPYKSTEKFEEKLKAYKIIKHGDSRVYFSNGQLKEIVKYKKGKVLETMRNYFEDGEECYIVVDEIPVFQFNKEDQSKWFDQRVNDIEKKYNINLEGFGFIKLEISKDGTIRSVTVPAMYEDKKKYLIEIGEQVEIIKPAMKNDQKVGTKFGFRIQL